MEAEKQVDGTRDRKNKRSLQESSGERERSECTNRDAKSQREKDVQVRGKKRKSDSL